MKTKHEKLLEEYEYRIKQLSRKQKEELIENKIQKT